jgi:hypothetical protein
LLLTWLFSTPLGTSDGFDDDLQGDTGALEIGKRLLDVTPALVVAPSLIAFSTSKRADACNNGSGRGDACSNGNGRADASSDGSGCTPFASGLSQASRRRVSLAVTGRPTGPSATVTTLDRPLRSAAIVAITSYSCCLRFVLGFPSTRITSGPFGTTAGGVGLFLTKLFSTPLGTSDGFDDDLQGDTDALGTDKRSLDVALALVVAPSSTAFSMSVARLPRTRVFKILNKSWKNTRVLAHGHRFLIIAGSLNVRIRVMYDRESIFSRNAIANDLPYHH